VKWRPQYDRRSSGLPNIRGAGGGATVSRERAAGQSEGMALIAAEVAVGLAAVFGSTTVVSPEALATNTG
jgi:hypothetical protein